jgi:hypothetical protein
MDAAQAEAAAAARKLVRTLDSAPDPQRQAKAAVAALLRAGGWQPGTQQKLQALADWLAARPPPQTLKVRLQQVLKELA